MNGEAQATTEEQAAGPQREPAPEAVLEALGDRLLDGRMEGGVLWLNVRAADVPPVLEALSRELAEPYEHLSDIAGADTAEGLQVVYHLSRLMTGAMAVVKTTVSRSKPQAPTVTQLWKMAGWAEREVAEMFGVEFVGHPDPRKLLLPDDWEGFPLRKDYVYPLHHPYLSPDPLREDPASVLAPKPDSGRDTDNGSGRDNPVADDTGSGRGITAIPDKIVGATEDNGCRH
jgi:NADH-quinone oxidoreductase subunit C